MKKYLSILNISIFYDAFKCQLLIYHSEYESKKVKRATRIKKIYQECHMQRFFKLHQFFVFMPLNMLPKIIAILQKQYAFRELTKQVHGKYNIMKNCVTTLLRKQQSYNLITKHVHVQCACAMCIKIVYLKIE